MNINENISSAQSFRYIMRNTRATSISNKRKTIDLTLKSPNKERLVPYYQEGKKRQKKKSKPLINHGQFESSSQILASEHKKMYLSHLELPKYQL